MSQTIWSQLDLIRLAEHSKPEVRRWACERMSTLYGEVGIEILERLLRDKNRDVLLEALNYLWNYPNPEFCHILLNLYENQKGMVAGRSAILLGKMKDERLISAYKRKIHSKTIEFDDQIWAIQALGELATPEARAILREILSETGKEADPFFIHTLIHALVNAKEDVHRILKWYSDHYRDFALEILHPLTVVCGGWFSIDILKEMDESRFLKKGIRHVVAETLDYLKYRGFSSLSKELHKSFKKENYSHLIERAWEQVEEIVSQKGGNTEAFDGAIPPYRNCQILRAFKEYLGWGDKDSLKEIAVVALIGLITFIEFESLLDLKIEDLVAEDLFRILFEDRGSSNLDHRMMDRLFKIVSAESIFDHSIKQLERDPYSFGCERAIQVLGRLKEEKAIPYLVSYFDKKASDVALDSCIKALVQMGPAFVDYLAKHYDQLNENQVIEILFVLRDLPMEETADFLLRHWDHLWRLDKETFLGALEGVASKRFIGPLRKELKEGEVTEEEVFYLLCHIHGVHDIWLPQIEERMRAREKEVKRRLEMLEREDAKPMLEASLKVELKCRQCEKSYYYDVENILMPFKEEEGARIIDKIVCKNCRAVNQYEITPKGNLAITSQMILTAALAEKGKWRPEQSPIQFGESGLMDGRRMSFDEIVKYYQEEIRKSPNDPAIRIGYGNVLIKLGNEAEAMSHYQKALRLDSQAVEAYFSLGEYEADKGNLSRAYEYFNKAYQHMHTGHYYRTKDPDQLKETIVFTLEHFEGLLPEEQKEISKPTSLGIVKRDKIGRNDPCPCGSGKKYKRCCLNEGETREPTKTSATPKEIEMRDRLLAFSSKEKYKKEFEKAYQLFYRRPFKEPLVFDEKGRDDFSLFLEWFICDFSLRNGMTIIEEFHHEKGEKLSEEERSLLKHEMRSYLSLYEVISVTPGTGLRLKDLMTEEEMDVVEVRGSLAAVKWDVFFARVIRGEGINKLSGIVILIPRRMKENVLSLTQGVWEKFKKEAGNQEWSYFTKSNAHLLYHFIKDQPIKEPVFVTEEYHRVCSSKAVFEVKDFDAVLYRLEREFDFIVDKEEKGKEIIFTWLKRGPSKHWKAEEPPEGAVVFKSEMVSGKGALRWTALGTVTLTPRRLELWCLSKERLDQGKRRLSESLGDCIQHRIDTYEDVIKNALERVGKIPSVDSAKIPEKFQPIFEKTMEEFVKKWVDEKIPALDGKTPKEAVKTPKGREKVKELLKDWENTEERKRKEGELYLDINILREMLGL